MAWIELSPSFSPLLSTFGGILIGGATSLHLLTNGRVTGISGIFGRWIEESKSPSSSPAFQWRPAFISGMLLGGLGLKHIHPSLFGHTALLEAAGATATQVAHVDWAYSLLLGATSGLLVGFGTKMGNGCTSGHGVCGLPRGSIRSLTAVCTFMATGIMTAIGVQKLFKILSGSAIPYTPLAMSPSIPISLLDLGLGAGAAAMALWALRGLVISSPIGKEKEEDSPKTIAAAFLSGLLFSAGLGVSGMTQTEKVLGFLDPVSHAWDPSLAFVMGGALAFNALTFRLILKKPTPLLTSNWQVPTNTVIDRDLVLGSSLFGLGWGIGGVCPGPGILGLASGDPFFVAWIASLGVGMELCSRYLRRRKAHRN